MSIQRLNHAVLYVRDARASAQWYAEVFGMEVAHEVGDGAGVFMRIPDGGNDHDLAFFSMGASAKPSPAGQTTVGLYHLAWQVDRLEDLVTYQQILADKGALVGASDHVATKSLYGKDPDGIEFEVMWLVPRELLTEADFSQGAAIKPLHLDRELTRFADR